MSIVLNAPGTTAQTISSDLSCIIHSLNSPGFTPPFPIFPLLHFQIYNYNCTIANLQLKITFYNCRKCHQLHVKIRPALGCIDRVLCVGERWIKSRSSQEVSMGSSSLLRMTETLFLASYTKTYTNLCFDCLVAMFSSCILRWCNRFTCNLYVITVAFLH